MTTPGSLLRATEAIRGLGRAVRYGKVVKIEGLVVGVSISDAKVGDAIEIQVDDGVRLASVVGFDGDIALAMPMASVDGIGPGSRVVATGRATTFPASSALLGRVVDPFGAPIDGRGAIVAEQHVRVDVAAPPVADRLPVRERFDTGVRVIDGLLTFGRGQRVGVFAGAGVGKTMLMRQILANSQADVVVVGLIGERGVEVADMMSDDLGAHGVFVVATSDRSPMERVHGARAATAVAEYFRDQGTDVLLVIDSLTRYAMALREVGLSAGEPPATKGYPPSVFAALPRLLERVAPLSSGGSITGIYTVLVEGDDLADPVADSARSLLDGHVVLSRDLAARGHFPAVDVLASASRVAHKVQTRDDIALARAARAALAARRDVEELRALGAYVAGQNPAADEALALGQKLDGWSRQDTAERTERAATIAGLRTALGGRA